MQCVELPSRLEKKNVPNENKGYYDSPLDSIGDVKLNSQRPVNMCHSLYWSKSTNNKKKKWLIKIICSHLRPHMRSSPGVSSFMSAWHEA